MNRGVLRRWSLRMMLMMVLMCMVCSMSAEVKVWHAKVVDDFGNPMPSVTGDRGGIGDKFKSLCAALAEWGGCSRQGMLW